MTAQLRNPNHPQRGSIITVEPIRSLADIKTIKKMLLGKPRDYLLFVMGINNGLRAGDLLQRTVGELQDLRVGDALKIREQKTGKINVLKLNKTIYQALRKYLEAAEPAPEEFLFRSRKGQNRPLTVQSVNALVKSWTSAINLPGNYGSHTLRKTWGYHQRVTYGVGCEIIARRFNHSSPKITMRYLGIEDKEVEEVLMNEI